MTTDGERNAPAGGTGPGDSGDNGSPPGTAATDPTGATAGVGEAVGTALDTGVLAAAEPAVRRRVLREWLAGAGARALTDAQLRAADDLVGAWRGAGRTGGGRRLGADPRPWQARAAPPQPAADRAVTAGPVEASTGPSHGPCEGVGCTTGTSPRCWSPRSRCARRPRSWRSRSPVTTPTSCATAASPTSC
ncbi:TilS substrate-binding domain-containing protein [Pseudonocardia sp. UM4_GMWB1]|uniref:TilS substrate-binding domain-containing protein n=1 Tax=Pseudonocardia sp. UM4_GMWB1 TaxID=2212989 RepID=UPI003FD52C56